VILLDEIEKAHPDVFNVLLQILDDGRLTDGQGHTVDFKNSVVIMTSNLGSQYLLEMENKDSARALVEELLQRSFRPEFLNRIDETIVFEPLDRKSLRHIIDIQIAALARRLHERKIAIELTDAGKERLIEEGFDAKYGARPLKRVIQRKLLDGIALKLLTGDFRDGDTIKVDADQEGFLFSRIVIGEAVVA
jgi:ATP-dependent Clp protease ATP-binding subunit ClpB